NPQPQRLIVWLQQEFKSKRTLEKIKTAILKFRHDWVKVYEYSAEFNRLNGIVQVTDKTKRLLIM
ncbi:hypothetical protein H8356DRAFT_960251, partial [Neocallimastix lanati (nom. inval.)]